MCWSIRNLDVTDAQVRKRSETSRRSDTSCPYARSRSGSRSCLPFLDYYVKQEIDRWTRLSCISLGKAHRDPRIVDTAWKHGTETQRVPRARHDTPHAVRSRRKRPPAMSPTSVPNRTQQSSYIVSSQFTSIGPRHCRGRQGRRLARYRQSHPRPRSYRIWWAWIGHGDPDDRSRPCTDGLDPADRRRQAVVMGGTREGSVGVNQWKARGDGARWRIAAGVSNRKQRSRREMTQIGHSRSTRSVQKKTRELPLRCWKRRVCRPLRPSVQRVIAEFRLKEIRWTLNSACSPRGHGTVMSHGIGPRLRPRNLLHCNARQAAYVSGASRNRVATCCGGGPSAACPVQS